MKHYDASCNAFAITGPRVECFLSIALKMTGACDKRCPFCCEPDRAQSVHTPERWKRIIDLMSAHGTEKLCITGGEPLLYRRLAEVLQHARERGLKSLLSTANGELLLKRESELLPYLSAVRFSIHGERSHHDQIVGRNGAFDWTERAVALLRAREVPIFIAAVVTRDNLNQLGAIAGWARRNGARKLYLYNLLDSGNGYDYANAGNKVSLQHFVKGARAVEEAFGCSTCEIKSYAYASAGECVLVYGDGRLVLDPEPEGSNGQLVVGNVLSEAVADVWSRLLQRRDQHEAYSSHLRSA